MNALSLGLELFRFYEKKLKHHEAVSAQDLRLAVWAIETTFCKRHQTSIHPNLLDTLNKLRILSGYLDRDTSADSYAESRQELQSESIIQTIATLNSQLTVIIKDPLIPRTILEHEEYLRLPKVILSRLHNETHNQQILEGEEHESDPICFEVYDDTAPYDRNRTKPHQGRKDDE